MKGTTPEPNYITTFYCFVKRSVNRRFFGLGRYFALEALSGRTYCQGNLEMTCSIEKVFSTGLPFIFFHRSSKDGHKEVATGLDSLIWKRQSQLVWIFAPQNGCICQTPVSV